MVSGRIPSAAVPGYRATVATRRSGPAPHRSRYRMQQRWPRAVPRAHAPALKSASADQPAFRATQKLELRAPRRFRADLWRGRGMRLELADVRPQQVTVGQAVDVTANLRNAAVGLECLDHQKLPEHRPPIRPDGSRHNGQTAFGLVSTLCGPCQGSQKRSVDRPSVQCAEINVRKIIDLRRKPEDLATAGVGRSCSPEVTGASRAAGRDVRRDQRSTHLGL